MLVVLDKFLTVFYVSSGSFLKPFKTLAALVLSGLSVLNPIKHCCSCFKIYTLKVTVHDPTFRPSNLVSSLAGDRCEDGIQMYTLNWILPSQRSHLMK